jgi:hypothetical protein
MEKSTLHQLLIYLDQEEISEDGVKATIEALTSKVDGCALFESELRAEIDRLKEIVREFHDAQKAAEKRLERFREYLVYTMTVNSFDKVPGELFSLVLIENPPKVEIKGEPSVFDAEAYPDFVRVRYEWNKSAIKEAIETREVPFARIVREKRPKFSVKRNAP